MNRIIASGAATNASEAIRYALATAVLFLEQPQALTRARTNAEAKVTQDGPRGIPDTRREWKFYPSWRPRDEKAAKRKGAYESEVEIGEFRDKTGVYLGIRNMDESDGEHLEFGNFTAQEWREFVDAAQQVRLIER